MTQAKNININHLQPNPYQPRNKIKQRELKDLSDSIKQHGILEPLVVAHTPAGYQIIAGERRWRAAKMAGFEEVPAIIKETSPKGMLEMALVENVQRVNLSPFERAQAFIQLTQDFGYNHTQIAKRIGKSPAYIGNTLRLLQLPDAIKDGLIGGLISEGHARALLSIADEKEMVKCYKTILKENASVRRAEELTRIIRDETGAVRAVTRNRVPQNTAIQIREWKKKLNSLMTENANVHITRSQKQTRISVLIKGDVEDTQALTEEIINVLEKVKRPNK